MQEDLQNSKSKTSDWVKRFGLAGFIFFLIKGLLWLIVPAILTYIVW
jgi:hypothetical protein